jgi:hypothetical protein
MPQRMYFLQECPTCGRSLRIRVEYLGRFVNCQHCRGAFVASDPALAGGEVSRSALLMQRAAELVEMAEARKSHAIA